MPNAAERREPARCPHCGLAVDAPADEYCCTACELAAEIVREAGLGRWYTEREDFAPRPDPVRADLAAVPVEPGPEGHTCRLAIDGLRCASCVWLLEHVLEATPGVRRAHVSYATGRAAVTFDPAVTDAGRVGARIAALGYRPRPVDAPATADRDLLVRLGVSAFCASNVMLLAASVYAGGFDGMEGRYSALFGWAQLALATPVALWSAVPFYAAAWRGLRAGVLHMDLPISLAILSLYGHGVVATPLGVEGYLDSLGMLVTLLLAGRVLESRGRRQAAAAAAALAATLPTRARRATATGVEDVGALDLRPGDRVEVGLGDEVPADGVVEAGRARVRLALLTGESEPVEVGPGDRVAAGAPVVEGAVTVRVDRVGEDTVGRRMALAVLASVDRGLAPTPADRVAPVFTLATLVAAAAALIGWTLAEDLPTGLEVMASVLVVACPCALGLAWPVAVSAGLSALARRGAVLRSGDALLRLAEVDLVALDKTGTVTLGTPVVVAADDAVLRIAAGLERASSHPVASAIRSAAAERGIAMPVATELREEAGIGVTGQIDGERWALRAAGPGEIRLDGERGLVGLIRLRDVRRADAPAAVARLRSLADLVLLTGDDPAVAARVAAEVGSPEVLARRTPAAKAAWVEARRAEGRRVLFVGDGLNDGPALVAADVGLAMKAGATSSVLAADGVVVEDALGPVVAALRVARVVRSTVRGNLVRSIAYNGLAVGFALAGLVDPLVAALLMPASSSLVLWGGLSVERKLRKEERWT